MSTSTHVASSSHLNQDPSYEENTDEENDDDNEDDDCIDTEEVLEELQNSKQLSAKEVEEIEKVMDFEISVKVRKDYNNHKVRLSEYLIEHDAEQELHPSDNVPELPEVRLIRVFN